MNGFNDKLFCDVVAIFCVFMTFFNVARTRSRGLSAYFLGFAFLTLGGTVYLYSARGASPLIWIGGSIVAILLIADIVYRLGRSPK